MTDKIKNSPVKLNWDLGFDLGDSISTLKLSSDFGGATQKQEYGVHYSRYKKQYESENDKEYQAEINIAASYDPKDMALSLNWQKSGSEQITLMDLLTISCMSGLNNGRKDLDIELATFSVAYSKPTIGQGKTEIFYIDLELESKNIDTQAFMIAVQPSSTTQASNWQYAFGFALNDEFNLSNVPLVGRFIGDQVSLKDVYICYHGISAADIRQKLNEILTDKQPFEIPTLNKGQSEPEWNTVQLQESVQAGVTLNLAGQSLVLAIPEGQSYSSPTLLPVTEYKDSNSVDESIAASEASLETEPTLSGETVKAKRSSGPVTIHSFKPGFDLDRGRLLIEISADLKMGPVRLSLEGLSVSNPLTKIQPEFGLTGLGIEYKSSNMTLAGALLRKYSNDSNIKFEFSGGLRLSLTRFQLMAMGSFAQTKNGDTSLFGYAVVQKALGGYPAFFVTGLAAGFGYNRQLISPTDLSTLEQYPLIQAAMQRDYDISTLLKRMKSNIPISRGDHFAAVGIKFTSFKVVESFALLVLSKSTRECDLIGLSRFQLKSSGGIVADLELALLAQIRPQQGTVLVRGQLTDSSYLIDKKFKTTGGFAVGLWLAGEHQGDFVYCFGGYGRHMPVPAHYPKDVPAISIDRKLGGKAGINVKGRIYSVLTPSYIAAGMSLEARKETSFYKAWFDLDMYAKMQWQPFYYNVGIHVNIGAEAEIGPDYCKYTQSFNLSAKVKLQGPPISGQASVDAVFGTIKVSFGPKPKQPPKLTWKEFESALLPPEDDRITINMVSGLIGESKNKSTLVINPKELLIDVSSAIPVTEYDISGDSIIGTTNTVDSPSLGIKPMGVGQGNFNSELVIHFKKTDGSGSDTKIKTNPINSNVPNALWDPASGTNSVAVIKNARTGFRLEPSKQVKEAATTAIDVSTLKYEITKPDTNACLSKDLSGFKPERDETEIETETETDETEKIDDLLESFGLDKTLSKTDPCESINFMTNIIKGSFNA